MAQTAIQVQDIWLSYGRKPVLKGISFQVAPGELVGLIGPNGSGKSTIIRALSRVLQSDSGEILINDVEIGRLTRRELARKVGVVPQMPLLPSAFTAFEIVLMGRNPHLGFFEYEGPQELDRAWSAMERTGTLPLAARRVNELSGGEIQCLLIARVLAQGTGIILLDEPTANLDIGRQGEIMGLIKSLCLDRQAAVLAAVHDLNLAAQYCDRLVLINEGRVAAEGPPAAVITPENIRAVYGAGGCVYNHPLNGLPVVLLDGNNKISASSGAGAH